MLPSRESRSLDGEHACCQVEKANRVHASTSQRPGSTGALNDAGSGPRQKVGNYFASVARHLRLVATRSFVFRDADTAELSGDHVRMPFRGTVDP